MNIYNLSTVYMKLIANYSHFSYNKNFKIIYYVSQFIDEYRLIKFNTFFFLKLSLLL